MSTIALTEDVGGPAYEDLALRWGLQSDPYAWKNAEQRQRLLRGAEAAVVRNKTPVDEAFFRSAPRLKIVARAGVGLDNIDLEAADNAGVVVVAPLGLNAASVAEHTLALALALSKNIVSSHRSTSSGEWDRQPTQDLRGRTWGLLSAGATARSTARLARAFGMEIVAYDPFIEPAHPEVLDIGIRLAPLQEVLTSAEILSAHLPNTVETHHLLNAEKLSLLTPGAIVINVGRGEVLDESALLAALNTGAVAGAGLDVREAEPPVIGELEHHPNVILTPHIAGITIQTQNRIGQVLCREIETVLSGGKATYAVGNLSVPVPGTPLVAKGTK